jgi:hypothetical protein
MYKVSYGVREVLMEEITKTSKSCCGERGVLGVASGKFRFNEEGFASTSMSRRAEVLLIWC